ncbi:MAG: roadblock/LC7 domain-containing protein [Thermoanaerobaculum sp.]|nr:roadblock/LC7 domain-containing protein [Thermoanaerobaculum sp.]MCX7895655.1 roadblock/LC7 domain-containing protein [Thermoanaerobaculum sp.]MDW7966873.1 roadblock/LC7 domain-containing protein [Thermoanaerobaculum sp.]
MSFLSRVQAVTECPGLLALAIADREGIAVESFGPQAAEAEEIVAEYTGFLREVTAANRELKLGELHQVVITGSQRTIVVTFITPDYFLFAVVDKDGNPGKARFTSRVAAWNLRPEFL